MQLGRFGEADRLACEPLDAGAQCQMLALNLLRIAFPRHMNFRGQPGVCSSMIGKEARDAKGSSRALSCRNYSSWQRPNTYTKTFPVP